jgi:gluconokinase
MFELFASAVDEILANTTGQLKIAAVAASSLASNVLALDAHGEPITPVYLYADTRNAATVEQLRAAYDWSALYARTGCPLHTAYLPARLVWLRQTQPDVFAKAHRFISLHEYFLSRLYGDTAVSHSFAAWTGMLNHATDEWDEQALSIAGIGRAQLSPLISTRQSLSGCVPEFAARWRQLANIPWYPALGDGAVANVGSGCTDATRVAVTIGTSGAMRVVMPAKKGIHTLPRGLWLYRVDETDGLLGGSLTDGGSIASYFAKLLQLPERGEFGPALEAMAPDEHNLTMLPFFGGERSPGYHGDARATITGWNLNTSAVDLWRAALEAVAYRFAAIFDLLRTAVPAPREIIASGGALLNSHLWVQILADVLNVPVTASGEEEASARGAALLALRALGTIQGLEELPASLGTTHLPNPEHHEIYTVARKRHESLYHLILDHKL